MRAAMQMALRAESANEVPIGAVLTRDNSLLGQGWNQPIANNDPTAHAEIIAMRNGATAAANYRLVNTTLYVTLEPCLMCTGAIIQARITRIVFGAYDQKSGALGSMLAPLQLVYTNHLPQITGGVLADDCADMLQQFFRRRRKLKQQ